MQFEIAGQVVTADPADEDQVYQAASEALDALMVIVEGYEDLPSSQSPPMGEVQHIHERFGSGAWHIALQEGRNVSATIAGATYTITVS